MSPYKEPDSFKENMNEIIESINYKNYKEDTGEIYGNNLIDEVEKYAQK